MALDTTVGGSASDSYVSVAEFDSYVAAMGLTATGTEGALRRARMYLDRAYLWAGYRVTSTQALQWPRYVGGLVDGYEIPSDSIPQAIKDAQCEMAYLIIGGADPFATITGGAVTGTRKKVDVIETETGYAAGTARDRPSYPAVDALVAPYVTAKAGDRALSVASVRS